MQTEHTERTIAVGRRIDTETDRQAAKHRDADEYKGRKAGNKDRQIESKGVAAKHKGEEKAARITGGQVQENPNSPTPQTQPNPLP